MSSASSTHGHVSHDSQRLSREWNFWYSLYKNRVGKVGGLTTFLMSHYVYYVSGAYNTVVIPTFVVEFVNVNVLSLFLLAIFLMNHIRNVYRVSGSYSTLFFQNWVWKSRQPLIFCHDLQYLTYKKLILVVSAQSFLFFATFLVL